MIIRSDMLDGHIFRQLREQCGITREQAAEKLGVSVATIRRRENAESVSLVEIYMMVEGSGYRLDFGMVDKHGQTTPLPLP